MTRIILAALFALAFGASAQAQTLAQPGQNGNPNTVVCITLNSTLTVGGVSLGATAQCFGLSDATAAELVGFAMAQCTAAQGGTPNPGGGAQDCTPAQGTAWLGQSIEQGELANVTNFQKQQAAQAAASAVTVAAPTPAN